MYKQIADTLTGEVLTTHVRRIVDNAVIPLFDQSNTSCQEYLEWVAEGNTPDPADSE